jgi:hypothetical protein
LYRSDHCFCSASFVYRLRIFGRSHCQETVLMMDLEPVLLLDLELVLVLDLEPALWMVLEKVLEMVPPWWAFWRVGRLAPLLENRSEVGY